MAEQTQEVLQTSQDTPPAQESKSNPIDDFSQESGGEEQSEHSSEDQAGKPENQPGQQEEQKPSRVERRISSLLGKLKESGQSAPEVKKAAPEKPPYISQQEIEAGEIDPVAFEQRLQQRIDSEVDSRVERALQMAEIKNQYTSAVKDHEADLESISQQELDPDIENEAAAEYERLNHQINPLTGEPMFVPAVKFSEIVAKLTARAEKIAEKMAVQNKVYRQTVSQTSAITPSSSLSSSKKIGGDTADFTEFEQAFASKA